jgi:hypothetical protein
MALLSLDEKWVFRWRAVVIPFLPGANQKNPGK